MKVFRLCPDADRFRNLTVGHPETWDILRSMDGTRVSETWRPLKVRYLQDDPDQSPLPKGDFPSLASHVPVFSRQAVNALVPLINDHGEFLPLDAQGQDLSLFNVTTILDALNEEDSEIERFASSGRIMRIIRYIFDGESVGDVPIFRIPQNPLMDIFVREEFVDLVRSDDLTGFRFIEIWTDTE